MSPPLGSLQRGTTLEKPRRGCWRSREISEKISGRFFIKIHTRKRPFWPCLGQVSYSGFCRGAATVSVTASAKASRSPAQGFLRFLGVPRASARLLRVSSKPRLVATVSVASARASRSPAQGFLRLLGVPWAVSWMVPVSGGSLEGPQGFFETAAQGLWSPWLPPGLPEASPRVS